MNRMQEGDREVAERIAPLVWGELHRLAEQAMRHERGDHTLQPTALANEAWLELSQREGLDWKSRATYFATASLVMRHTLVNHARARRTAKRGGGARRNDFEVLIESFDARPLDTDSFIDLDSALEHLRGIDERKARIIDLRFFCGLTIEEAAGVLDLSPASVGNEFRAARAWLREKLGVRTPDAAG
ncbi:MAG: RNA polymerase subunit sigma-70 [Planctomycetes bacterium]|nr:RNA polymerase subunit sigma-70 [Planctomycetota bacterium]